MADTKLSDPLTNGKILDRRLLCLGLIPAAVYVFLSFVLSQTRPDAVVFETIEVKAFGDVAAAEAHLRYLWVSAFLVSGAVSLAVAASCALSLWSDTPADDRGFVLTVIAAVIALITMAETLPNLAAEERWHAIMGKELFQKVFGRTPDGSDTAPVLQLLDTGLDLVKACGVVALTLIAAGLIMTLVRIGSDTPPDRQAEDLARAQAEQLTYLRLGGAVYVFALIAMLSWMYWPLPFLADDTTRESYRQLVVGTAVLQGVSYSVGIAAIYLPPALILRRRAFRLASSVTDTAASADSWLAERRLGTHPLEQLRQLAIMVSPTIVSILPAVSELWR